MGARTEHGGFKFGAAFFGWLVTLGRTALLSATAGAIGVGAADPSQLASSAGTAANSRSFLLRVYRVRTDWETPRGGRGHVEILDWITLRDPDDRVPVAVVTEGTRERLLTGGDFDIESLRVATDGTLWFGEEFGPFLLHTDPTGRLLDAPIPVPGVRSPDYPGLPAGKNNLGDSSGFEGMALSDDGKTLYPALQGPLTTDPDQRRRLIFAFDVRSERYTGRRWQYRMEDPGYFISDFTVLDKHRYIMLERDDNQDAAARHKKAFVVDLRKVGPDGFLVKSEVLDLLKIRDPALISPPARTGDIGIGNPFSMPYGKIESVLPLGGKRLVIVNDTNFGSRGRNPNQPDYSDFVVVRVPALAGQKLTRVACPEPHHPTESISTLSRSALAAAAAAALAAPCVISLPATAAPPRDATLEKRAILPAEATAQAPFPGIPDTEPAPAPGSTQPVGGFSALLDAPGKDTYWAMPDNGFRSERIEGAVVLLAILGLAYFAGGSVAGRIARFNGFKQGLGVWTIALVVAILLALGGALSNVIQQLSLPPIPVDPGSTSRAVVALGAFLLVTLGAALLGGKAGTRFHRKIRLALVRARR